MHVAQMMFINPRVLNNNDFQTLRCKMYRADKVELSMNKNNLGPGLTRFEWARVQVDCSVYERHLESS